MSIYSKCLTFLFQIMLLQKLFDRMGLGSLIGRSTNHWTKIKVANRGYIPYENGVDHTLKLNVLRERNGSRGNGLGMGHRNKKNKMK